MSTETRDLNVIDEALEAGATTATDPHELELQELALLLREETTGDRPSDDFRLRMDSRVAAGFPRRGRAGRALDAIGAARAGLRLPRLTSPAFAGAAASVLLALAVTVALVQGGEDSSTVAPTPRTLEAPAATDGATSGSGGGAAQAREETSSDAAAPESAGGAEPDLAQRSVAPDDPVGSPIIPPEPPPGGGSIEPGEQRQVERSAQLTLAEDADRMQQAADRIVSIVGRHRGFVMSSNITSGDDEFTGGGGGTFDLRIPARRLPQAINDLSKVGELRSLSQSGQDVTAQVTSLEEQLERARADRRGLLRRLERADTEREARAIRERLRLVQSQINGLRGQLNQSRERVTYAQVTVSLIESDGESAGDDRDGAAGAWDDFVNTLEDALGIALRTLGVLLPIALVVGLFWLVASRVQRRRRESALGQ